MYFPALSNVIKQQQTWLREEITEETVKKGLFNKNRSMFSSEVKAEVPSFSFLRSIPLCKCTRGFFFFLFSHLLMGT